MSPADTQTRVIPFCPDVLNQVAQATTPQGRGRRAADMTAELTVYRARYPGWHHADPEVVSHRTPAPGVGTRRLLPAAARVLDRVRANVGRFRR